MGRHKIYVSGIGSGYKGGPRWGDPYHCEWSTVVGDRVRRRRRDRDMTLIVLARAVHKPEGGHYSPGYISRLERGWASAPLYVYLAIADVLEIEPGRLLGPDDAQAEATGAEMTLVRFLRETGMAPHAVLAHLARPTACPPQSM